MRAVFKSENNPSGDARFNVIVNIFSEAFFGSAFGFASFITIIPLFVSQLTDSAILIGLIPAIQNVGWQLPQLLTVGKVRRLSRYKPMVLAMSIHERLPYFGLGLVAYFLPDLERKTALVIVFSLLIWRCLGGGLTATVWTTMLGKIIPVNLRGGFLGIQSSASNLLSSAAAVAAGQILERFDSPLDFTLCFLLAGIGMIISYGFLATTRELDHTPAQPRGTRSHIREDIKRILRKDKAFRRFLGIRMTYQLGLVAFSYYAVYAVGELDVSVGLVGWLTGVLIFMQMLINPLLGALGDRKGHRLVLLLGTLAALLGTMLAGWTTSVPIWFLIFALAGITSVTGWTTAMILSLEFGAGPDQATYIGMSNTLIAPAALAAPFLAGWVINALGYPALFFASAGIFLIAAILCVNLLRMGTSSISNHTATQERA